MIRSRYALLILTILAIAAPSAALAGLAQTFQQTGNLGLEVAGAAGGNVPVASGTLALTSMPPAAMTVRATLYASQINNASGLDAVFGGFNLGTIGPSASDPAFNTLYTYQWDVTSLVMAPQASYPFTIGQNSPNGSGIAGVALVVVWQDPLAVLRTVTVIDGMQQVGESGPETESITFTALPPGTTSAWIFTVYDDATASGEVVAYNGTAIGGPIDGNLGFNASLLQMSATSLSGSNTLAITTGADHMGWMIGATAVDLPPVAVEARTWGQVKAIYR